MVAQLTSAQSGIACRIFFKLAVLLIALISPLVSYSGEPVRFAPEKDYGPFVYLDEKNEVRGLSVDMLAAISQSAGLKIETLPARSLSEILAMAERGEVDLISSLRPTPERAKYLSFSSPYVSVPAVLLTRAKDASFKNLDALKGAAVAVGKGYAVEAFVHQRFPDVRWIAVADDVAAIKSLQAGTVDAVVADIASIGFVIRQQNLSGLAIQSPIGFEYSLSFGYSKSRPDIGEALERGQRSLRAADRDTVVRQWIDADALNSPHPVQEVVKYVAATLALVSIAILVLSRLWRMKSKATSK